MNVTRLVEAGFHVDRVMRKIQVATRMQATIACVRLGLIEP
ncbi:hypothetical protein ACLBXO_19840 [Methylobacterium sp. C33D]